MGLVKVFKRVILEGRCIKALSSTLQGYPETRKSTKSSKELRFQRDYKKRELVILFSFWSIFILTSIVTRVTTCQDNL